ncbi:hypothetical protein ACFPL7_17535 [Dongia soli]|uniref:Motility protein YjfB-like n=1 Tax=Dongia soli TaxID=600628 RepID=A0ABU5E6Q3_9PROT|nr:hypothetical protein [Dongia soli]MDY0881394.1 hypothetical protein [Dongia soli]
MDIAAAGAAAVQMSNAQRAQQVSIASMRQAKVQGQTLTNLLAQAAALDPAPIVGAAAGAAPSSGDGAASTPQIDLGDAPPNPNLPRGSLVNILV